MDIQTKHITNTFFEYAETYLKNQWSVIPVWGTSQPEQFKVAAIRWSPFSQYLPTEDLLHHWFVRAQHQGVAIITGRISGIAVLDFDEETVFKTFCQQFPQLTKTYTVKTPRGWHLYFAIPEKCSTQTRKGQGIDWQWERRYVVAPPTQGYSVQNKQTPHILSQEDLTQIHRYLDAAPDKNDNFISPSQKSITTSELTGLYRARARSGNRNNSLFQIVCLARDHAWNRREALATFIPLHIETMLSGETVSQRRREAKATIKSAYSHPPRPIVESALKTLPNTIKEALMQQGLTCVLRVLEGLSQSGYIPGQIINRSELFKVLLPMGIGHHSIKKSITTKIGGKNVLPSPEPPTSTAVARATAQTYNNKCYLLSQSKPSKTSTGGRPGHSYRIPTHTELAELLDVEPGYIADEIPLEALSSAKTTRQAYHRAFIARKPGKYRSGFLAWRVGVSIITKNRYDKEIPDLYKRPTYTEIRLFWDNLKEIPDEDVPGIFLQDNSGKKYPARRDIACRLIGQGRAISLMKQGVNYYWIGISDHSTLEHVAHRRHIPQPIQIEQDNLDREAISAYWQSLYDQTVVQDKSPGNVSQQSYPDSNVQKTPDIQAVVLSKQGITESPELQNHKPYRPFTDDFLEMTATNVQKKINQSGENQTSLKSVRQLICLYGRKPVWSVMKRVEARKNIENPIGLMTVILRSEHRIKMLKDATLKQSS